MAVRMAPITIALPDSPAVFRPSLKRRPPPLTKSLDDPFRLFPGDLFQVISGLGSLPLHNQRGEVPVQIAAKSLVAKLTGFDLTAPGDPGRILACSPIVDDRVVSCLLGHGSGFLLAIVGDAQHIVRDRQCCTYFGLEGFQIGPLRIRFCSTSETLIRLVGELLGFEALWR